MSDRQFIPIRIAVLTVSDTRQLADDKSGQILVNRLINDHHILADRKILPDERKQIANQLRAWSVNPNVDAVVSTGGTGLTGRDVTVEAHRDVYEKEIDAFSTYFTIISKKKNWHLRHPITRLCRRGERNIFLCPSRLARGL